MKNMVENSNIISLFLDSLKVEKNLSKNTQSAYITDIEDFAVFLLKKKPKVNLNNATDENISDYLKYLHTQKSFSSKTQSRRVSSIRAFYLFCYKEGLVEENPSKNIKNPKLFKSLPKFLSTTEVDKLISVAQADKNIMFYTMLEVLYATGMRVSELVSLKLSSLIENNTCLLIKGKGDKERIVPLTNLATKLLLQWKQDREKFYKITSNNSMYFFPSSVAKQGYITRERFAQILKSHAIKANIDYNRVSPHVIRHSFASHLLNNGGDLKSIQNLLGHADISTTEIYTHISSDNLQRAIHNNHPLSKLNNKQ